MKGYDWVTDADFGAKFLRGGEVKDYDWVTDADFGAKLRELVGEMTTEQILATPGVYEILREELNNEVLSALEAERDEGE